MAVVCIFFSLQLVINMMLQGMKRYKVVYLNEFTGIIVNICLDIPIILFLDRIGLPAYIGSMFATITGVSTSLTIVLVSMKKTFHFRYKSIARALIMSIIGTAVICVFMIAYQKVVPEASRWIFKAIRFGMGGLLSSVIYFGLAYKSGALAQIYGRGKTEFNNDEAPSEKIDFCEGLAGYLPGLFYAMKQTNSPGRKNIQKYEYNSIAF